jgi:(2Fe-2S) ferredoxin
MEPTQKPRRLVLCIGDRCNTREQAHTHFDRLRALLGYPNPFNHPPGIKWEVANCLDQCERGPNLVIYPDGIWYHDLDSDKLEEVIATHILPLLDPAETR